MNGFQPNLPPLNVPAEFYLLIIILRPTLNGHQIRILPHRFLWVSLVSFCWLKSVNCTCACSSAATHRRVSLAACVVVLWDHSSYLQNQTDLLPSKRQILLVGKTMKNSIPRLDPCWSSLLGSHCFRFPLNVTSHSWHYFCTRSQAQIEQISPQKLISCCFLLFLTIITRNCWKALCAAVTFTAYWP